jgi:Leucine-rich repeat (LRR) protein
VCDDPGDDLSTPTIRVRFLAAPRARGLRGLQRRCCIRPRAPPARPAATADKPFTSLDQALADPEDVHALILSRTRLTALPPAIGKLVHLRSLVLNRNTDLTEILDELGHLPELIAICLGGSPRLRFAEVLRTLQQLPRLEGLGIDDNQLGAVPDELAGFPRLKRLGLSGDALTALPPSIGALTSLESLDLYDNALTALSAELSQLTRLRVLYVKGNPLPPSELERVGPHFRRSR